MKQLTQTNLLARNNLSDQIFDLIGNQIIRNKLQPGEMIYETKISKDLGVSRSPVRDALRMLEQIWLVERTPKGSYQVTDLSIENIQQLYETANLLYQYAFAKAAEKATEKDLRQLEKAMTKMEESIDGNDVDLYLENVTKMAHKILEIAGNPLVERIARELMPTAERIQLASVTYLPDQLKKVVSHIRRAYESIVMRNPKEAAKAFKDFSTAIIEVVIGSLNQSHAQNPAKKLDKAS